MDNPSYRASVTKQFVQAIAAMPPGVSASVMQRVQPKSLELVDKTLGISWLEATVHVEIADALYGVVGSEEFRRLWTALFLDIAQSPILRAITEGAKRVLGLNPKGLVRMSNGGWEAVTRGLGTLHAIDLPEPRRAALRWTGYPSSLARTDAHLWGMHGTVEGYLAMCNLTGTVMRRDVEPGLSGATYELAW